MTRRQNIQGVRSHRFERSSRLFPIVHGLDLETRDKILRAMEELCQEIPARISEALQSADGSELPN